MARWRRRGTALLALLPAGWLLSELARQEIEARLRQELETAIRARQLPASIGQVRFAWHGPLRLEDVRLAPGGRATLALGAVEVDWSWRGGREPRRHLRALTLESLQGRTGELTLSIPHTRWIVASWAGGGDAERVHLVEEATGADLRLDLPRTARRRLQVSLSGLEVDRVGRLHWQQRPLVEGGRWGLSAQVERSGERLLTRGTLQVDGVRVAPFSAGSARPARGAPARAALDWNGWREGSRIHVEGARVSFDGTSAFARGEVDLQAAARPLQVEVQGSARLARAREVLALELPEDHGPLPGQDLGLAWLRFALQGDLFEARSLEVDAELHFAPPAGPVPAVEFLRRGFRHAVEREDGGVDYVDVQEGMPGFVPLREVPPLFQRAVLISEDAGFYGHPGIDVVEIPVAWATNLARGTAARGASTITQQLVKNLFLSREKSYARKAQEALLALLVDALVPKTRLLEVYLNVIEWGPRLYGIGPAAQHWFGRAPGQLTPRETAFLACVIPGPVKYHQAHAAGQPGPGLDQLVDNLLLKLRSVDALSEGEYQAARAEQLRFAPETP